MKSRRGIGPQMHVKEKSPLYWTFLELFDLKSNSTATFGPFGPSDCNQSNSLRIEKRPNPRTDLRWDNESVPLVFA